MKSSGLLSPLLKTILPLPIPTKFIIFYCLIISQLINISNCIEQQHQFVSGVYQESLPPPIFYETYIPIVFEYALPEWNKSDVTFNNWYSCITDALPYKSCAVMYHLNKAISNLHTDFQSIQPVQDTASHSAFYSSLYQTHSFCDKIQKHFNGIYIQQDELNNYIEMLKNCHSSGSGEEQLASIESSINDYNYSMTASFNRIEVNFYETFYKPINASSETIATAILANSRSNIQATLLGTYYAEKYRWVHALQDCQQSLLPHSLVSITKLNQTLLELEKTANFETNYEFAIPLDLISKYYSLPLTDCTYTDSSFVVRILFPIKLKAEKLDSFSLISLKAIPFRYDSKLCSVTPLWSKFVMYDSAMKLAYSTSGTTCEPNSLCQISDAMQSSSQLNMCASALINQNFTSTKLNCDFQCKEFPESLSSHIFVSRVGTNKYVLTGGKIDNSSTFVTHCEGEPFLIHYLNWTHAGATEITLGCKCHLIVSGYIRKYYSEYPCENSTSVDGRSNKNLKIVQIEPWHLINDNNIMNKDLAHEASKHVNCSIDSNLIYKYSVKSDKPISQPQDEQLTMIQSFHQEQHGHNESSVTSHTLIWLTFLSISTIFIIMHIYMLFKLRSLSSESSTSYHPQRNSTTTTDSSTLDSRAIDNLLYYKVTGGRNNGGNDDTEPEVHLLSHAHY